MKDGMQQIAEMWNVTKQNKKIRSFFNPVGKIMQHEKEAVCFMDYVVTQLNKIDGPKTFVEIGCLRGNNFVFMGNTLSHYFDDVVGIAMDISDPNSGFARHLEGVTLDSHIANHSPSFKWDFIEGDSHSQEILDKLSKTLEGRTIDMLFIDGDHEAEGCRQDFTMYTPLVSVNGIIGVHDACYKSYPGEINQAYGVQIWKDLRTDPTRVMFSQNYGNRRGIGTVIKTSIDQKWTLEQQFLNKQFD